jgi:hypothetical protein
MIVSHLFGGLGNQMFQYAAGRRLSHQRQTKFKLDITWYDEEHPGDTPWAFGLDCFNLSSAIAKREELPLSRPGVLGRLLDKTMGTNGPLTTLSEASFAFNRSVLDAPDNTLLAGYWQSEKYFVDITETIRAEFTVKSAAAGQNAKLLKEIRGATAVSLHVRRGDYITNANASKFHGASSLDYYYAAAKRLTKDIKRPTYFVFSDDPQWCEENLKLDYRTVYVDHNPPDKGYEDIRLMSACQHHIIANSSFSWWGAWLNSSPDKIVIAPKQWFKDSSVDTEDVYAKGWIKL